MLISCQLLKVFIIGYFVIIDNVFNREFLYFIDNKMTKIKDEKVVEEIVC